MLPQFFKILLFVLKSSRFDLKDRVEYFTCLIFALIGASLIIYTAWTSLNINYFGLLILGLLFLRGPSLYQKFVAPYYESLSDREQARKEAEGAQYLQELSRETVIAAAKTEFFSWVLGVIFVVLVLLPALFLLRGFSLTFVGVFAAMGFLLWIIVSILTWRKIWKPVSEIEASAPKHFRRPLLFKFLLVMVILIAALGFMFWRYQQITGRDYFESQLGRQSYVNNLPEDKYLLIQQTKFTDAEVDPSRNPVVSSSTFTLNLQNGFLDLKFPRERDIKGEKITLFDSPESIIFIRIRDDEIGREFNTGKYDISSVSKLPVYLDTSASYYSSKIVGVEADGTLLIEQEAFDPKVAKMYKQEGKVRETIKLLVGQSFPYTTEDGDQMTLLNLGLFVKDKVIFAETTMSTESTPKLKLSPITTLVPHNDEDLVIENFSITKEGSWYIARGLVTNQSQRMIKPIYV